MQHQDSLEKVKQVQSIWDQVSLHQANLDQAKVDQAKLQQDMQLQGEKGRDQLKLHQAMLVQGEEDILHQGEPG